ncbi:MAG: T9SS type A sorting domain-containing protein, partial [Longimonas sp.]|uniref:T9SS type A sorting domain-containing protein n=1 Tax=Longimonas sp. TaxID=2039626 RepID=UPI003975B75A
TSSAGTNAPRFDQNVVAMWDDSDSDESTGGTGAYITADASTPLGHGSAALLYLQDDARDPVESGGLTISLDEGTSATRHGTAPVVRDDLTRSARWHLLGNPYPTDYELSSLTTGGSPIAGNGFKADAQIYDATAGGWELVDTETETLAAWQGAFIERSDPDNGPTEVTFEPDGRTDSNAPFIGSEMQGPTVASEGVQRGTLWLEGVVTDASGDPVATDQAIGVRFHESATDGWDAWDTSKLAPLEAPSLMLSAQGTGGSGTEASKAVESRPWPQSPDDPDAELTAVPMAVQGNQLPEDGTLTLRVREWDLPDTWAAELIDTQGTSTESDDQTVPLEPGMDYQVDVSSLSANPETERFVVQIAPNTGALPVELAGFEAQRSGDEAITVQWETLSETNNAGFEVQRSVPSDVETSRRDVSTGESWETVARLDGAGTTDEPQSYRFEDADLPYAADSLSYRLRQVDTDGTESFSEAVTIARLVTEAELLPTYPNPARSTATVRFAVPERQDVRIHLYDMLGRRVQTVVDTGAEGRTEQVLDVSRLASGTYFLQMETEDGPVDTQRVTVVR